ncbi:UNKNOWN [Stylonychia lemnae]|uniref:Uncharacterized protein n=1 Tax=Stylonychia lemnae TaxID=5949 RepID=A0A078B786_STYLE|nr:UNKNOWN [Stylonychia lemnae]|eukprot:CDW90061.1 UNKNOWN [Stylonychia lemnae]
MEKNKNLKGFKFCYVMQGLPGSGKSTVAKQLAGQNGKIFSIDKIIMEQKKSHGQVDQKSTQEIYDTIYQQFCDELKNGTECIVIDNTNLSEWEYIRFIKTAQKEHYFSSLVALPPPEEIQTAVERSNFDVNDNEMTQMLARWEPFSPMRLMDKTLQLQGQGESLSPPYNRGGFHRKISSQDLLENRRASMMVVSDTINESQEAEEDEDNSKVFATKLSDDSQE